MGNNLSDKEKKEMIGLGIGAAVGLTILTAGVAAPIAAKGVETVINYASSQEGSRGGSSSCGSNMLMGSGHAAAKTSKTNSPV